MASKSPYTQVIGICQDSGVIQDDELTEKGLLMLIDRLLEDIHITVSSK